MKIWMFIFILFQLLLHRFLFSQDIVSMHQQEVKLAYKSRQTGDWLTLVNLAKYAYNNQEDTMWQNGLIQWAEEIIEYRQTPSGARHLGFYYHRIGDDSEEYYWKNLADFWENKRTIIRRRMG